MFFLLSVIGSGGGMIMSIEQESGAKVTFVKDNKREKFRGTEHMVNMEQKNEDDERAEHQDEKQITEENKDVEVETQLETLQEENTEKSIENNQVKSGSEERFPNEQENVESGMWSEKKENGEDQNGCQSEKGKLSNV